MRYRSIIVVLGLCASVAAAGCTDSQGVNAATGALAGAAIGNQFGSGTGRTAATLGGAAAGAAIGGNVPTN